MSCRDAGKKTALRDVHNMLQAIRSERRGDTTDATRTEYVLREFVSQEKGNSATIFVDSDTQQAHVVVFQSARMKRLFQAFPEVVLVDTTHGTNANQYKLFSFAVTDFFGRVRGPTLYNTENLQTLTDLILCVVRRANTCSMHSY